MSENTRIINETDLERIIGVSAVTFHEIENEDGSISVSWDRCASSVWNAVLKAIKSMIPQGGRKYSPSDKLWTIGSSYIPIWEQIKRTFSDEENVELRDELIENATTETIAEMQRYELSRLPQSMRARAIYAIKATLGLIDTQVEYSLARDEFGAWDAEDKVWKYTDGRYSWTSPSDWDKKRRQVAFNKIQRAIDGLPELVNCLRMEDLGSWRYRFRLAMLEKYEYQCYVCRQTPTDLSRLHMHRVIPGKDGGEYIEDNIVILCHICHNAHEGEAWEEFRILHEGGAS